MPTTVAVIGASGGVGAYVVAHALKAGHKVRAACRTQKKLEEGLANAGVENADALLQAGTLEFIQTDLFADEASFQASLKRAVDGATHVISCLGNVRG